MFGRRDGRGRFMKAEPAAPPPDVVYVVRPGQRNEELRYSLRSLANVPHGEVWIAGDKPQWVKDVRFISVIQRATKWENSTANLQAACSHPELSEEFIYFNDDMFVMHPMDAIPPLHRGPIDEVIDYYAARGRGNYSVGMRFTKMLLEELGHTEILSYELHVPMVVNKTKMLEVLALPHKIKLFDPRMPSRRLKTKAIHKRTLYGNVAEIGGTLAEDCKVFGRNNWSSDWPFISTTDDKFNMGDVGKFIRKAFPEPSPYERT